MAHPTFRPAACRCACVMLSCPCSGGDTATCQRKKCRTNSAGRNVGVPWRLLSMLDPN